MRQKQGVFSLFLLSPSSRRAWIEIRTWMNCAMAAPVALLAEGVDRNLLVIAVFIGGGDVALLAEGVDRNRSRPAATATVKRSPSSRRAWIEIVRR